MAYALEEKTRRHHPDSWRVSGFSGGEASPVQGGIPGATGLRRPLSYDLPSFPPETPSDQRSRGRGVSSPVASETSLANLARFSAAFARALGKDSTKKTYVQSLHPLFMWSHPVGSTSRDYLSTYRRMLYGELRASISARTSYLGLLSLWLSRQDQAELTALDSPSVLVSTLKTALGASQSASGLEIVFSRLLNLFEVEDEEDVPPSAKAFETVVALLLGAADEFHGGFPRASAVTDEEGGIHMYWMRPERSVQLSVPASDVVRSYIFHAEGTDSASERPVTGRVLADWLKWVDNA